MNGILYECENVRISYLHSPELGRKDEVISEAEYELWMKYADNWNYRYVLQRDILRELVSVSGGNSVLDLMSLLNRVNPLIIKSMENAGVGFKEIGFAFRQAYQKEEELRNEWIRERD